MKKLLGDKTILVGLRLNTDEKTRPWGFDFPILSPNYGYNWDSDGQWSLKRTEKFV